MSGNTGIPDWWVNRIVSAVALLLAGLTLDWQWYGCALAWAIIAGGFLLWSISDHEARP